MDDFEAIYREHAETVYLYLVSLTRSESLSEELMQETMLRAIMNIGAFRGDCKLSSWLCRIAKNLYLDRLRRERRIVPLDEADISAPEGDIAREYEERDTAVRIFRQMCLLEEPYREVFRLHALGGVPLKEISRRYGRSESWARVTYYRAKAMIIEKLD